MVPFYSDTDLAFEKRINYSKQGVGSYLKKIDVRSRKNNQPITNNSQLSYPLSRNFSSNALKRYLIVAIQKPTNVQPIIAG